MTLDSTKGKAHTNHSNAPDMLGTPDILVTTNAPQRRGRHEYLTASVVGICYATIGVGGGHLLRFDRLRYSVQKCNLGTKPTRA